ncbi:MAG: sugar lactone lactonase YvrE [Granulosicoccus sp.]
MKSTRILNKQSISSLQLYKLMKAYFALAFGLSILLSSCVSYDKIVAEHSIIRVGPGPEDFVFDMEGINPRLIVSCAERRKKAYPKFSEFWEINLNDDQARIIPHIGLPDSIRLHAHGIDIGVTVHGKTLFVVNHEVEKDYERQSVLLFKVFKDSLVFKDLLINPDSLVSPNDVCFDGINGLFISNDAKKRGARLQQILTSSSYVLHVDLKTREWSKPVKDLVYANGVGVNKGKLYVSGVGEKGVKVLEPKDGSWTRMDTLGYFKGADNIMFYDNELYTTTHPSLLKFIGHVGDNRKNSPGQIFRADLKNGRTEMIYEDDGSLMSAPSTAFRYNESIYVAQVFRPYILKLPLPKSN